MDRLDVGDKFDRGGQRGDVIPAEELFRELRRRE